MKQTCLCEYLNVACNHADTFLRIPLSIRRRIYLYAGLTVGTYTAYPTIGKIERDFTSTTPQENHIATYNLTQVCPQICGEVEAIILRENTLLYADDDVDKGLSFLARLDPDGCYMLRNVHVQLRLEKDQYGRYFRSPPPLSRNRIEKWQHACANMLAHASPQELKLHLICDTGLSQETAAVLEPFRRFPGVLRELELRLHQRDDKYIQGPEHQGLLALARDTAILAQGRDPNAVPSQPFRFFDLPAELRRHVFQYTSLVAPYRRVHWTPGKGFYARFIFCECDGADCRDEDLHANNKFSLCDADSRITEDYCMGDHSSYSPRCIHGFSPLPLLLTSRAMYEDALDFFYSNNRIVIQPWWDVEVAIFAAEHVSSASSRAMSTELPDATGLPNREDEALQDPDAAVSFRTKYISHDSTKLFVERVGAKSLQLLRNVEVVFPRIGPKSSLSDTDPAYKQWCAAVGHLERLATDSSASNLTLVVHLWATPACDSDTPLPLESIAHRLRENASRLLEPLRVLPQLKRLFVHLEWPSHWAPPKLARDIATCNLPKDDSPGRGIGYRWVPRSREEVVVKEAAFEKMVMGAEYDSYSLGKGDEMPSQWARAEWGRWS